MISSAFLKTTATRLDVQIIVVGAGGFSRYSGGELIVWFSPPYFSCMAQWHSAVRSSELGVLTSCHALWSYECRSLDLLQPLSPPRLLHPSSFTDVLVRAPPHVRHPYVSTIVPSSDGQLLSILSCDARVEVHQPVPTLAPLPLAPRAPGGEAADAAPHPLADSLRLSIRPADTRARAADLCWQPGRDAVVLGMADRSRLWAFDVETCCETKPCHVRSLSKVVGGVDHGVTDMAVAGGMGCVVAACRDKSVYLCDFRQKKPSAVFSVPWGNNVVAADEPLLFVCGGGAIRVYDVRTLGTANGELRGAPKPLKEVRVPGSDGFCFAKSVMSGSRLAFQNQKGLVGLANMITGEVEASSEPEHDQPQEVIPGSGMYELGAMEQHRRNYPWYIERRRGVVVPAPMKGGGWRIVAPCVGRTAVRVVPVGLPKHLPSPMARPATGSTFRPFCSRRTLRKNALREVKEKILPTSDHVACLMADDQLQRLVLGLKGNAVDVCQMQSELEAVS